MVTSENNGKDSRSTSIGAFFSRLHGLLYNNEEFYQRVITYEQFKDSGIYRSSSVFLIVEYLNRVVNYYYKFLPTHWPDRIIKNKISPISLWWTNSFYLQVYSSVLMVHVWHLTSQHQWNLQLHWWETWLNWWVLYPLPQHSKLQPSAPEMMSKLV